MLDASGDPPAAFDWRTDSPHGNVITPVKNQDQCGGCWAFSAAEGVESASAIAGNKLVELSPQQLIDCANGTAQCINDHCSGGNYVCLGEYLEKTGIETEAAYPFVSGSGIDGVCHNDEKQWHATGTDIVPMNFEGAVDKESIMLSYLVAKGPISAAIAAKNPGALWQDYQSGVYTGSQPPYEIDHAIQIVGYGTDEKAGDYWTLRNSWGESWGEAGYIRIPRGVNAFGIVDEHAAPAYYTAKKINKCSEQTCLQCTADTGCGWCASTKSCTKGTAKGPEGGGACPASDWAFGTCDSLPCQALSCATCLPKKLVGGSLAQIKSSGAGASCGWCGASQSCEEGNTTAPADCDHGWTTEEAQCSASAGACSTKLSCDDCAAQQGCGWCSGGDIGGHCLPGNETNPTSDTCDASSNQTYAYGVQGCDKCSGWSWSWYRNRYACLDGWRVPMTTVCSVLIAVAVFIIVFNCLRSFCKRHCGRRQTGIVRQTAPQRARVVIRGGRPGAQPREVVDRFDDMQPVGSMRDPLLPEEAPPPPYPGERGRSIHAV